MYYFHDNTQTSIKNLKIVRNYIFKIINKNSIETSKEFQNIQYQIFQDLLSLLKSIYKVVIKLTDNELALLPDEFKNFKEKNKEGKKKQ